MKKAMKGISIILAVLLTLACVAGTVVFFYKRNKIKDNKVQVLAVYNSHQKTAFDTSLANVDKKVKDAQAGDTRFEEMVATNQRLNKTFEVVSSYYVEYDYVINNVDIAKTEKAMTDSMNYANAVMAEYIVKYESEYLPKNKAANDSFAAVNTYLTNYADYINKLSNHISWVDKTIDAKFAMIDLYTKVVIADCSQLETDGGNLTQLKDKNDLSYINGFYDFNNLQLNGLVADKRYSVNYRKFIVSYFNCDTNALASNLKERAQSTPAVSSSSSNEDFAVFYLKDIYGL